MWKLSCTLLLVKGTISHKTIVVIVDIVVINYNRIPSIQSLVCSSSVHFVNAFLEDHPNPLNKIFSVNVLIYADVLEKVYQSLNPTF